MLRVIRLKWVRLGPLCTVLVRFIRLRVRGLDTFAGHVDGDAGEREVRAE